MSIPYCHACNWDNENCHCKGGPVSFFRPPPKETTEIDTLTAELAECKDALRLTTETLETDLECVRLLLATERTEFKEQLAEAMKEAPKFDVLPGCESLDPNSLKDRIIMLREGMDVYKSESEARGEQLTASRAECERYIKAFGHVHVAGNGEYIDTCKKCGMDIREKIHARRTFATPTKGYEDES